MPLDLSGTAAQIAGMSVELKARQSDRQQRLRRALAVIRDFPVGEYAHARELEEAVCGAVDEVDGVVGGDVYAVGVLKNPLAPGVEESAVAVEDHKGMVGAGEDIDAVLGVDGDAADLIPLSAFRELAPVGDDFVL